MLPFSVRPALKKSQKSAKNITLSVKQTQKKTVLYALVDANNFYASCERIFRPDLMHTPLVVLSNNDGCIVARSKEAKALGIGMGEPYFKAKNLIEKHNVAVFSSNYALYGDISQRIISVLESCCDTVENLALCTTELSVSEQYFAKPYSKALYPAKCFIKQAVTKSYSVDQYSIDEAFINLDSTLCANAKDLVFLMRDRVAKWVGIQVSIGLGQTRTLAKLANHLAKKNSGIYYLDVNDPNFPKYLKKIEVADVWGIGRKSAEKLQKLGIYNAFQLQQAHDSLIRKYLTVTGWNTVLELRGIEACAFESLVVNVEKPRQTIVSSRSFAEKIYDIKSLEEAISQFTTNATERLRSENLLARGIQITIRTSKHCSQNQEYYAPRIQYSLLEPSADTRHFLKIALRGLKEIYRSQTPYAKAGIMLFDIVPQSSYQGSLLSCTGLQEDEQKKSKNLMTTLDTINHKFGRKSIFFGSVGDKNASWHMKQKHKSQSYTSKWTELANAHCQ